MNWPVLTVFGIAALALIAFLVWRNLRDEEQLEDNLNQDYPKSKDEEGDVDTDEIMK